MVVDDELRIRDIVGHFLSAEGYEICACASGQEALDKAADFDPDLVLLDVMMPGLDGFETCRRLFSEGGIREVPVAFLTAKRGPENWERADDVGAKAYLEKPFQREVLLALVKELHEKTEKGEEKTE